VRRVTPVEGTKRWLPVCLTALAERFSAIRPDVGNTSKRISVGLPNDMSGVGLQSHHQQNRDERGCGQGTG